MQIPYYCDILNWKVSIWWLLFKICNLFFVFAAIISSMIQVAFDGAIVNHIARESGFHYFL